MSEIKLELSFGSALLGIASSGFPIPDLSGPEEKFPDSGNFISRSGKSGNGLFNLFQALAFMILTRIVVGYYSMANNFSMVDYHYIESPYSNSWLSCKPERGKKLLIGKNKISRQVNKTFPISRDSRSGNFISRAISRSRNFIGKLQTLR